MFGLSEGYREEIVGRVVRNLLDVQILRLVEVEPLWGYRIKKQFESDFNVKLRHGALYPTLNVLEQRGFLLSRRQQKDGRARKVYAITTSGREFLSSYYGVLREQIRC